METSTGFSCFLAKRSTDPTYKEWKHEQITQVKRLLEGTDPTYKEWKRTRNFLAFCQVGRTDPTYKEWKHV